MSKLASLERMRAELRKYEDTLNYYEQLFNEDGRIDELEQNLLDNLYSKIENIKANVETAIQTLSREELNQNKRLAKQEKQEDEASDSDDIVDHSLIGTNSAVSFHVEGIDIVGDIYLKDESGKIVDSIKLEKGFIRTGSFVLGEGAPVGNYSVEITGTHFPIVRGGVWKEGRKKLSEKIPVEKNNVSHIPVLIDFPQENLESDWYPDNQDNPMGATNSTSLAPSFAIESINLRRRGSNESLESWQISPEDFKGEVKVVLSENKYPDDIYYYEILGTNGSDHLESREVEKIDQLTFILSWESKVPSISVNIELDFDPRWICFIHESGEEETVQITGERPYTSDVSFVTSDIVTKRLMLGDYTIKIAGVGDGGKNEEFEVKKIFTKSNLYSRFEVSIKITDKDLTGERDIHQITNHFIQLADNWWKEAVHLINEKINNRFKNKPKPVKGLLMLIDDSLLGDLADEFGQTPYIVAKTCEKAIATVVEQISRYANQKSQEGQPTLEEILNKVDVYISKAQAKYSISGLDKDDKFHDVYLYQYRHLTTKKMLLQIEKDLDTLIVGKSMSQFVNNLFN